MATQPSPDPLRIIPLSLVQAIANYIRQNPSTGPVDAPLQIIAALQQLQPLESPKSKAPPSKPITPTPSPARKKALRKARSP